MVVTVKRGQGQERKGSGVRGQVREEGVRVREERARVRKSHKAGDLILYCPAISVTG